MTSVKLKLAVGEFIVSSHFYQSSVRSYVVSNLGNIWFWDEHKKEFEQVNVKY